MSAKKIAKILGCTTTGDAQIAKIKGLNKGIYSKRDALSIKERDNVTSFPSAVLVECNQNVIHNYVTGSSTSPFSKPIFWT